MEYMKKAVAAAKESGNDLPVGAVIVKEGRIISAAHNEVEMMKDVTAHAEILAIREASVLLDNWRLNECDMYVTLEPCPMCAWAILRSRIKNLYFGAYDTVYGAFSTIPELQRMSSSSLIVKGGIMEEECRTLLDNYFRELR